MKKISGAKKGLIYALVTAMIATSTVGTMPLNASAASTGTVNADALNVRSGAGTSYSRVGSVSQGQTVTIVDSVKASDGYTWYKISGTVSGYVRSDFISGVSSNSTSTSTSTSSSTGTITADYLNVRTGPGTNYSRMGGAVYGTRLTVISVHGSWYKVTCKIDSKIKTGYVHSDYVQLDSTGSGSGSTDNSSGSADNNSGSTNNGNGNTGGGSGTTETVIATGKVNVSDLNLRSAANTSSSVITVLVNQPSVEILEQTGSWYKVRVSVNGSTKTGYVYAEYVTKTSNSNTSTTVNEKGVVNADALNVRSGAGTGNSVVDMIYLNTSVDIVSQTGSWYNIKYTKNGTTKTGYVSAEYITKTSSSTTTPTPTPTPEYTSKTGIVNADVLNVRSGAGTSYSTLGQIKENDKVTVIGEEGSWYKVQAVINGTTKTGYVSAEFITIQSSTDNSGSGSGNSGGSDNGSGSGNTNGSTNGSTSVAGQAGTVIGSGVNFRTGPGTSYGSYGTLNFGTPVTIISLENDWYKVKCIVNGVVKEGYIYSEWLKPLGADDSEYEGETDTSFEEQIAAFPESYKNALRKLHEKHPNWKFVAYNTGMSFESAVNAQDNGELSMVYFDEGNTPFSWLSTKASDYNWATDTYVNRDGASWKSASKELVAYYMDPRNFLDEQQIFMFETMAYDASQSRSVVAGILDGTYMTDGNGYTYNGKRYTYVDTFMEAGKTANVSPYILASRSRQEVGNSDSFNATGSYGYYNFFNIGANASASGNAVQNGINYASQTGTWRRPWTSPWLAIVGGAEFLASEYINRGQNTDYFQKFNVVSAPYHQHQYMGNVQAPCSEAMSRYGTYSDLNMLNGAFTFIIPVYSDMPSTAAAMPTEMGNPNYYLKSLSVSGMSLNQTFTYNTSTYYGTTSQTKVTISATTISKYATIISGTGTHNLTKGNNQISVVCQAGNGDKFTYTLNIYCQ